VKGAKWQEDSHFKHPARKVTALPSRGNNLKGPAGLLASSAKILLIASTLLAIEAGILIVLGEARDIVIKPFVLLGYVEICAMLFSSVGIICGMVGLILYRPYLYLTNKILFFRARRAPEVSDRYTYFENIPSPLRINNTEEDGAPD
jgi:hypothetical protein